MTAEDPKITVQQQEQIREAVAAQPRPGQRPAVIDEPLRAHLREYLRFRHFFRQAYSADLEWQKLRPLVEGMHRVLVSFRTRVDAFLEEMSTRS